MLIAGRHDSLTDTMIFAHIDNVSKDIYLVSIPRDLYLNGRKINSIYASYGMDELARQLSQITGYKIDKYALIDMYAFIEAVDLVGGIDVHLDSAVIDPSYKTFDDGKWGTLSYLPGDYHLNGVQALRIARSRHFSSDFDRAARQQLILNSLKTKAQNLGFGDAGTLTSIIETVLGKVETNISLQEALSYYFRYQGFEIHSGYVLSGANVLVSSNYQVPEGAGEEDKNKCLTANVKPDDVETCSKFTRSYILLPRNNNWDVVKWYFGEVFGGKL